MPEATDLQRVLSNIRLLTMDPSGSGYTVVEDAALVIDGELIAWLGAANALPASYQAATSEDFGGRLVTPGLIDCHTHLVYGGNRAREFEMRLQGASYEEISRAGGGIVSTVNATRESGDEDLLASALTRVDAMIAEGVTTVEIKSGYGLDVDTELRMLRVARRVAQSRSVQVQATFLGAHALPQDYADRSDAYIDEVCIPALSQANDEALVDAVDGFCEGIAFSPEQIERVFTAASEIGLAVKLHREQLSNLHGAALAARFNAISADHLEYLDTEGVKALAAAGTVAVLLPGAFYALRETQMPPVQTLRDHQVPIAIATVCNPGSSPLASLLLTMNMACTLFRLTPEEALAGVTANAARALGLTDRGALRPGLRADLAIWSIKEPAELAYRIGFNPLHQRIYAGRN